MEHERAEIDTGIVAALTAIHKLGRVYDMLLWSFI